MFVLCYNGIYEILNHFGLETRIAELIEEGFTPDEIMVFDAYNQVFDI